MTIIFRNSSKRRQTKEVESSDTGKFSAETFFADGIEALSVTCAATDNMAAITLIFTWYVTVAMLLCTDPGTATTPAGTRTKVRRHSLRSGKAGGGGGGGGEDGVCELEISCKSDDLNPLLPVRLPIRGPRGPPGPKGDRGAPGDDGTTHLYPNAGEIRTKRMYYPARLQCLSLSVFTCPSSSVSCSASLFSPFSVSLSLSSNVVVFFGRGHLMESPTSQAHVHINTHIYASRQTDR